MNKVRPRVLALDLEGTLISNAASQIPRPGLFAFLSECRQMFERVVIFTTVREPQFRAIARLLASEGDAPAWFADVEYVTWHGQTKDLSFVPNATPEDVLLVDDFEIYVHTSQKAQWVQVQFFDYPYPATDAGLSAALEALKLRVGPADEAEHA